MVLSVCCYCKENTSISPSVFWGEGVALIFGGLYFGLSAPHHNAGDFWGDHNQKDNPSSEEGLPQEPPSLLSPKCKEEQRPAVPTWLPNPALSPHSHVCEAFPFAPLEKHALVMPAVLETLASCYPSPKTRSPFFSAASYPAWPRHAATAPSALKLP